MSFVGHEYQKERAVVLEQDNGPNVDGMEDSMSLDGSDSEASGSDEGR